MGATLLRKSWLKRVLQVETAEGGFRVEYCARGGWNGEAVYLDGQLVAQNPRLWFGPVLVFPLGSRLAAVEVRGWPWFCLRSFHLLLEDEMLYAEGDRRPFLEPGWAEAHRVREAAVRTLFEEIRKQLPWFSANESQGEQQAEPGAAPDRCQIRT
jgi:hypothetical protein